MGHRSLTRLGILTVIAFVVAGRAAYAGIVIEISPEIRADGIRRLVVGADTLTIRSRSGAHTIHLPSGALPLIALWARHYEGGPLVFSGEIAAISSSNDEYYPPITPLGLKDAMFEYDGQHAALSCAAVFFISGSPVHPLTEREPDGSLFPPAEHRLLLDPSNRSARALWYRDLASRYIRPPTCEGGQLTIKVVPAKTALPLSLQIDSHRYLQTSLWYRKVNTMSEVEQLAAALPYEPLKDDVERRWSVYRQRFKGLDELSSIVETLAVLHSVYRDRPALWEKLSRDLVGPTGARAVPKVQPSRLFAAPEFTYLTIDESAWPRPGSYGSPAANPRTGIELLLQEAMAKPATEKAKALETVSNQLDELPADDPALSARLMLARALTAIGDGDFDSDEKVMLFLDTVANSRDFVLRADGIRLLLAALAGVDQLTSDIPYAAIKDSLDQDLAVLAADLTSGALAHCNAEAVTEDGIAWWDALIEQIYSTGLLALLTSRDEVNQNFVQAVACAHWRRGVAPHLGKEIFFRHAHFRFLKYLDEDHALPPLTDTIRNYRGDIATALGLENWDESALEALGHESEQDFVEGDLISAECLFSPTPPSCTQPAAGYRMPLGVRTSTGFSVLLAPTTLDTACSDGHLATRVRAWGRQLPGAFAVERVEKSCDSTWQTVR